MLNNFRLFICVILIGFFSIISSAQANWRDDFKTLRLGMLQSHPIANNPGQLNDLTTTFTKLLGVRVEVLRFKTLGALMDAHASARVHYAFHTARSFATTKRICNCIQSVVRPKSVNGNIGFRSVLVTRKTAGVAGEMSQSDKRIGFSKKNSISGWLMPNVAVESGELGDLELLELGNVKNMIDAFQNNEIDGFFGWIPVEENQNELNLAHIFGGFYTPTLADLSQFEISWWSNIVHHGPHAVHRSVPNELVQDLTELLVNIDSRQPEMFDVIEPFFSGGYVKSERNDYNAIMVALSISAGVPVPPKDIEISLRPSITN